MSRRNVQITTETRQGSLVATTRSFAEMFLGSPFSLPLPLLTPLGGGFCLNCLIRAKSAGVGDLSLSSRDMTEGESDWSDSEVSAPCLLTENCHLDHCQSPESPDHLEVLP